MMAYDRLLDDAALFPPGELPLPEALPAHHDHHAAWYAELVGPFVFPASRLHELAPLLDGRPIELSLTVPGGPTALAPALHTLSTQDGVRLVSVEIALPEAVPVSELLGALDEQLPEDVLGYVEVPRGANRRPTMDALAGTRYRAKFRTGGVAPEAHPDERELAEAVLGAVTRAVPFKCTAGLHHAVRHTAGDTGFEQHGFLNVLLATEAALRGAGTDEVAALLGERSARTVAERITGLDEERVHAARSSFLSFGTCSITDPVAGLIELGLLAAPTPSETI